VAVGVLGGLPTIPGTQGRDFAALVDQVKGKAFLEAYQSLKGGGAISEPEGRKATEAIARLDRSQTQEGFDRALNDLESVIKTGVARAQHQAGAQSRPAAAPDRSAIQAELRRRGLIQ
jgi:hypothetical protein